LKASEFDYYLPEYLIAQDPVPSRDESRLLVVSRESESFAHKTFRDLTGYLRTGDVLVINETKVIPARLMGVKEGAMSEVEVLLIKPREESLWEALVRPGRRLRPGSRIIFGEGLIEGTVIDNTDTGGRLIRFESPLPFAEALQRVGRMPLPPYIKKYPQDPGRYQTVYAAREGSVAAPTAGLHFTGELLEKIKNTGVEIVKVLLHVGIGTFRPVRCDDVEEHHMHEEYYEISGAAADALNEAKNAGRRVIAVGTTSVRCLEAVAGETGKIKAGSGLTDIFIYPGYKFKVIDGMVTNFHLPRSTLIMMVSAFAGRDKILKAYKEAVAMGYKFFSFGDAMLIL